VVSALKSMLGQAAGDSRNRSGGCSAYRAIEPAPDARGGEGAQITPLAHRSTTDAWRASGYHELRSARLDKGASLLHLCPPARLVAEQWPAAVRPGARLR
jgi:hypothetical protein